MGKSQTNDTTSIEIVSQLHHLFFEAKYLEGSSWPAYDPDAPIETATVVVAHAERIETDWRLYVRSAVRGKAKCGSWDFRTERRVQGNIGDVALVCGELFLEAERSHTKACGDHTKAACGEAHAKAAKIAADIRQVEFAPMYIEGSEDLISEDLFRRPSSAAVTRVMGYATREDEGWRLHVAGYVACGLEKAKCGPGWYFSEHKDVDAVDDLADACRHLYMEAVTSHAEAALLRSLGPEKGSATT